MEEIQMNDFKLLDAIDFAIMASYSKFYLVNKDQARILNIKYNIDIYWSSIKKNGEEFDSYLADFTMGENEHIIGSKMLNAFQSVFENL